VFFQQKARTEQQKGTEMFMRGMGHQKPLLWKTNMNGFWFPRS